MESVAQQSLNDKVQLSQVLITLPIPSKKTTDFHFHNNITLLFSNSELVFFTVECNKYLPTVSPENGNYLEH